MAHVNNGRYSVSEDGTLSISSAHLYDSGRYVCTAINDIGSVRAAVNILVTGSRMIHSLNIYSYTVPCLLILRAFASFYLRPRIALLQRWKCRAYFFKPPPPVGAGGGYMFSGRPSVRLSVIHVVVLCFRDISSIC